MTHAITVTDNLAPLLRNLFPNIKPGTTISTRKGRISGTPTSAQLDSLIHRPVPTLLRDNRPFPCTSCGLCCTNVTNIMPTKPNSTTCVFLHNSRCSVYQQRPNICRIQMQHQLNADACNRMIRKAGLDDRFLVKIGGSGR